MSKRTSFATPLRGKRAAHTDDHLEAHVEQGHAAKCTLWRKMRFLLSSCAWANLHEQPLKELAAWVLQDARCARLVQPTSPAALACSCWSTGQMTPVGFEPTQLALVELESTPLDHSGKVS